MPAPIPHEGERGVPTNIERFVVVTPGRFVLESLTSGVVTELGEPIQAHGGLELVVPIDLEPDADYQLGNGIELRPFRTGSGPDLEAPSATLQAVQIARADVICPEHGGIEELSAIDQVLYLTGSPRWLDVTIDGGELRQEVTVDASRGLAAIGGRCDLATAIAVLDPAVTYCFTVQPRDLAGNVGGPSMACTTVIACAPVDDRYDFHANPFGCPLESEAGAGCHAGTSTESGALVTVLVIVLTARRRRPRTV